MDLGDGFDFNASAETSTGGFTITAAGNTTASTITGSAGGDILTGSSGGDTITGGSGADALTGGNGDDLRLCRRCWYR